MLTLSVAPAGVLSLRAALVVFLGETIRPAESETDAATPRLAMGGYNGNGEVRIWDTGTGACIATFTAAPGYAVRRISGGAQ